MKENGFRLKSSAFQRPDGDGMQKPKKFFILSVEGFHTEKDYFNHLNFYMKEKRKQEIDAEIHVLGHENDGCCSPEQVYKLLEEAKTLREKGFLLTPDIRTQLIEDFNFTEEQIQLILDDDEKINDEEKKRFKLILSQLKIDYDYYQFLKDYQSEYDRFVIVIDRDCNSHTKKQLKDLLDKCNKNGIMFCITNPCFEFWLYLHSMPSDTDMDNKEKEKILENKKVSSGHTYISKKVSELQDFNKKISSNTFSKYFAPNIKVAMANAQKFAQDPDSLLDELGTMVAELLKEIGLQNI